MVINIMVTEIRMHKTKSVTVGTLCRKSHNVEVICA